MVTVGVAEPLSKFIVPSDRVDPRLIVSALIVLFVPSRRMVMSGHQG
jgi:hypothetical protein